jgi:hypothetical protein
VAACEGPLARAGGGPPAGSCATTTSASWPTAATPPASVRGCAFDLLHFARWLAGQDIGLDGVDTETIVCLLIGGAVSDRCDRRVVMLVADVVRALVPAARAALFFDGRIETVGAAGDRRRLWVRSSRSRRC